jgi:hypothetical protein
MREKNKKRISWELLEDENKNMSMCDWGGRFDLLLKNRSISSAGKSLTAIRPAGNNAFFPPGNQTNQISEQM